MSAHPSTRLRRTDPQSSGLVLVGAAGKSKLPPADALVLELVSHGLTDEQIAGEIASTADDVGVTLRRVVEGMGARNRTHAVALALKSGLIQ